MAQAIGYERETGKPSLIACRTTSATARRPRAGTATAHGEPLGADEIAGAREELGWAHPPFEVPGAGASPPGGQPAAAARRRGRAWAKRLAGSAASRRLREGAGGRLAAPSGESAIAALKARFADGKPKLATRQSSQKVLEALLPAMPGADRRLGRPDRLERHAGSPGRRPVTRDDFSGRYIHYGVREHAMAAAMNGIALHGGLIPYGGTFLAFADYSRPAIRLAALMGIRVIHVMTHDSIGLGEDGPTHQPVEHLAALRAIPNLLVFRPADAVETAEAGLAALAARERRPRSWR